MILPAALILIFSVYAFVYIRRKTSGLDKIPTIGSSGLITSWLDILPISSPGYKKIQEGYNKYPIFKISRFFSWLVLIHKPEHLKDLGRAREDQLSALEAVKEAGQFDYTIGPEISANIYHFTVVRGPMTRNIATRFADLVDETDRALFDILSGADKDWVSVPCYMSVAQIVSSASSRFFVGRELSLNMGYSDLMKDFTIDIVKCAVVLRILPTWLKPIVCNTIFKFQEQIHELGNYIRPILMDRFDKDLHECSGEANDVITWLWNAAPEHERTIHNVALRMVFLSISSIHNLSFLLTHVLFNLAIHGQYIEPLREEINSIVRTEGWTKAAIDNMQKLDSFIKESQRLHGSDAAVSNRVAMSDFAFSDGTVVPKGCNVAVAARAINLDERYYPNPQEFQGFRFVGKDPSKWQMTALNPEFTTFGTGRHACPGRFLAAVLIKLITARILLDYDIKLTDERGGRPQDRWYIGTVVSPNQKAEISLRKRTV